MKRRLLSLVAVPLAVVALMVATTACQPTTTTYNALRNLVHGLRGIFGAPAPVGVVVDPRSGKSVDCTVLLHYPDRVITAPVPSGFETHIAFAPLRTDPNTWNTFCHHQGTGPVGGHGYIVIVKINQALNTNTIGPAIVVYLKPMRVVWPLGQAFPTWVGDGFLPGRMDVTDFTDNYLIGRPWN